MRRRKKAGMVKPNVIPILDAVFIFIFFLLMSAQFLEIYEIGSDAPAVKTISEDNKDKRPPLNLTMEIKPSKLIIKTGVDGIIYKTLDLVAGEYDFKTLNKVLSEIKTKHVDETSIILRPSEKVPYKKIVYLMDSVRSVDKDGPTIVAKNKQGRAVETRTLFDQIIFETII
jgi:biopolymer transport protein ExbD